MSGTFEKRLSGALRATAEEYAAGDQVAPCVVLWTDPGRLWESVMPAFRAVVPELFVLGEYSPENRVGPALWLRCIEAREVDGAPPSDTTPVFYLPGIGRDTLRAAEDCPQDLAALVELQYRGVTWLHVNGKEWTPYAFLVSKHGGLGLDVAKDQSTLDALAGALHKLMSESLSQLRDRRLDSEFFNELVSPDATGLVLRWLSDVETFRERLSDPEWKAFCDQCNSDFQFDPVKDGPLKAASMLPTRSGNWRKVWQRFEESPLNYPGLVEWLRRATPKAPNMFDTAEVWPELNEMEEGQLQKALELLADRPQDEVIAGVADLESKHARRRDYPWQKLGLSPWATALAPLAKLADLCKDSPGAPDADGYAQYYASEGWRVDAAATETMAACGSVEQQGAVLGALRAVYLPWLETTSRHLQDLVGKGGQSVGKRLEPIRAAPGRVVLFADGLRMDVSRRVVEKLAEIEAEFTQDWDWSTIPSVTATAKPAVSPVADAVQGGETADQFTSRLVSTGKILTQARFVAALKENDWQILGPDETGDPSGSAWTEVGTLDKRGHSEGWKLARSIETDVVDLVGRVNTLLRAGWIEVIIVTDHGWLLVPGGLPKVELKSFLTENRWGRCAALKSEGNATVSTYHWHWNADVPIACPPGVGCYRAGTEYSHGGVSLQEMVIPVLHIKAVGGTGDSARLLDARWTGARCRVAVGGDCEGVRVDVRSSPSDPSSSVLVDKQFRETTPEGQVSVFLEDDANIGMVAEVVLIDESGQVIDSLSTTLGG